MDDQNTPNASQDAPQTDLSQSDVNQSTALQTDTMSQAQGEQPSTDVPAPLDSAPTDQQTQPSDQPQPDITQPAQSNENAPEQKDYIENVGGSTIDLLQDINENDDLIQVVAQEMRLDSNKVKEILTGLINKITQGQIKIEELALIMAAPVVDELPEQPEEPQQPTQ